MVIFQYVKAVPQAIPNKEAIEQSYGSRSKLLLEHRGKNIFDTYRLEDHEGKEITVSELVDKYLSNPELCFKEGWSELESSDVRFPAQSQESQCLLCHTNHN